MILVAGSANLDFVVRASHIPAPGETVLGREFQTFSGGKGANQAIACARAGGAETEMLLALGTDVYAAPIEASLAAAGVRTHVVRVRGEATGTAFICVSDTGENAITVAPGANGSLRREHLPSLDRCTHVLMQLETPLETVTAFARAARSKNVRVVLNAAPGRPLPPALLADLDVLVVNERELAIAAGTDDTVERCVTRIGVPCVVVTLGERGCCARQSGEWIRQDAFPIVPVDTTAAGDTFCGVLVAGLSASLDLPSALRQAGAAAALACTRLGAQASIPTRAELQSFLRAQS
jgi:ribokinase